MFPCRYGRYVELGDGGFATVIAGRYQGKEVAVKIFKEGMTFVSKIAHEMKVLRRLRYTDGVARLIGVLPANALLLSQLPALVMLRIPGKPLSVFLKVMYWDFNHCQAEYTMKNMKVHSYFLSFLSIETTQGLEVFPRGSERLRNLFCIINNFAVYVLAAWVVRTSSDKVLTWQTYNIQVSASDTMKLNNKIDLGFRNFSWDRCCTDSVKQNAES